MIRFKHIEVQKFKPVQMHLEEHAFLGFVTHYEKPSVKNTLPILIFTRS